MSDKESFKGIKEDLFSADLDAASESIKLISMPKISENGAHPEKDLAEYLGLPFVSLKELEFSDLVLNLVPADFARKNNVIPLGVETSRLCVAMAKPNDQEITQSLSFITGLTIDIVVASKKDVEWAVRQYYGAQDDELALESIDTKEEAQAAEYELERLGREKPIVRLVNNIIRDAIVRKASDIHIRPREKNVELIYRLDGSLVTIRFISKSLLAAVVSRIKIIGGMDIAERRLPQDGRSCVQIKGNIVDLRISIMPTVEGESVVVRLLNSKTGLKSVADLGFTQHDEDQFRDLLHKSNGIFLVTGPTGSGKTTTLYAALEEVKQQNVNIITVEDPVEYRMDGIEQIQVNHTTGYTFSRALRNILRHDPDVILLGEIRDEETGKIAVESALTGHLVLSTLHTNDASGAITRLLEMGVEPYLLNSCLLGVLAQRLVKKNCPHCLQVEEVDDLMRKSLNIPSGELYYIGKGCEHCNQTGVVGRLAVYELLRVTPEMKEIIKSDVTTMAVQEKALLAGMESLTRNALQRARNKEISLAEVYRIRLD